MNKFQSQNKYFVYHIFEKKVLDDRMGSSHSEYMNRWKLVILQIIKLYRLDGVYSVHTSCVAVTRHLVFYSAWIRFNVKSRQLMFILLVLKYTKPICKSRLSLTKEFLRELKKTTKKTRPTLEQCVNPEQFLLLPQCFPLLVIGYPFNYRDFLLFDKICSKSSAAELSYKRISQYGMYCCF